MTVIDKKLMSSRIDILIVRLNAIRNHYAKNNKK